MTRISLPAIVLLLSFAAFANAAFEHVATFSDPASVGSGHTPGTGGILHPTAQNFQEDGLHVEAFWAFGDLSGYPRFDSPHFHHLENGFETSHGFSAVPGYADLQGIYIERIDGKSFDLVSLDFQLTGALQATSILISATLNPTQPFLPQFAAFPVTRRSPDGFTTLTFEGFENLTSVFISSVLGTSSLNQIRWDNIVVRNAPEASSFVVWSLLLGACVGVAHYRRKKALANSG